METNQPVSEEDEPSHDYSTLESECDEPLYPNKVFVAGIIMIIIIIISLFDIYFSYINLLLDEYKTLGASLSKLCLVVSHFSCRGTQNVLSAQHWCILED